MCWNFRFFSWLWENQIWNGIKKDHNFCEISSSQKTEARNYTDGKQQTKWNCLFLFLTMPKQLTTWTVSTIKRFEKPCFQICVLKRNEISSFGGLWVYWGISEKLHLKVFQTIKRNFHATKIIKSKLARQKLSCFWFRRWREISSQYLWRKTSCKNGKFLNKIAFSPAFLTDKQCNATNRNWEFLFLVFSKWWRSKQTLLK